MGTGNSEEIEALEAALQRSEQRYRGLLQSLEDGYCTIEVLVDAQDRPVDYRFLETNEAFARHTGLQAPEGRTARELVPDLDASWFRIYGRVALTGESARFEKEAPAMGRWFEVTAFRTDDPGLRRVAVVFKDITSRVASEAALKESEARLQAILDAAPSVIAVKDLDGRYVFVNRMAATLFGRPREEVLGRTDEELALPDRARAWRANDRKVLETGEPLTFEEPGPAGQVFLSVKFPLRNLEGAPYALCSISSDVSELRRVEVERERLASVQEQMVRIVSHDVRSPLAALLMSAQALERQPLPDNVRRASERIQRSARRVEQVVRLMLDFTRSRLGVPIPVERRPVDLREIARHVAEELQSADPQRRVVLVGEPACGEGDPDRLYQVLANLMENAFKYGDRRAPVTVTTSAEDGELVAAVHNEGPHIPEALQARMFQPFTRGPQTEETVKVSMGLGLSIVDQLVKAHGGRVLLRSVPGEGTTFTIRLPRGDDACE